MIPTPPGILTDDEYEQIMGAGGPAAAPESERSFWLAQVNQYRAFRVSAPREKDLEAQRQRLSRLDALALDPDGEAKRLQLDTILTAAPEQQAAAKDALLIDSMLAERASRRVNISGSVWDANKPPSVLAADRDAARDALAVEMFGETAPRGSDAAVAGKLREAAGERQKLRWIIAGRDPSPSQQQLPTNVPASMHGPLMFPVDTKQDAETKAINEASLARNAWRAGLAGLPVAEAFAQWKEAARKSPAWSPAADKQDFFQQFRAVYGQADDKAAPLREKVRSVVENILAASRAEGEGAESMMGGGEVVRLAAMTKQITDAMAPLEDMDPETLRSVVMPTVRALAETRKDPDGRDMWDKIVASFRRPIARSLGASWDILSSLTSTAPMMGTPTPETAALVTEERQAIARRDIARSLLREATVSVIDPILTSAKTAAGKLAEQAVYDVAGSLGYMATTAIPYAGMAMTAASFADQNLANLLNSNPTMKVADAGVLAWAAAPVQAGLEKIQQMGLIGKLPGFNKAMNALAGPGGNPLARFAIYGAVATGAEYTIEKLQDATPMLAQDLLASLKEDVPNADWRNYEMFDLRTLLAVAPLALIGAGVNVARDSAASRELMSSTAAMKAVGMSDEAIEAVKAAPTVQAKMEAVADGYAQRDADTEPDVAWQETAAGAIADEEMAAARDLAEQSDAVGIRAVRRNSDGSFTVVANDGSAIEAASAQEAADVIERISDEAQDWANVAALAEISEALDMRPNAPTGASQTTIRDSMSVAEVIEEQTAIANDPDATLAERTAAQNYITNLQNRVEIYEAANKGKKVDLRTLMVGGQSEMEVREGVATAVVQVARGASPYTVLEERVEADATAMLRSGEETTATFAAKIREIEKRTGGQYLFGYTGTDAAKDSLAVKEALSLLTQIYVTGKARAGQAGTATVPRIVREYRKGTRAKLKAAESEGVAKSVFDYLKSRVQWLKTIIKQAIRLNRAMAESRAKGEEFPLESFLQRVTGVAPGIEAAKDVQDEADLIYNPREEGDDVWAFNLTEQDARHADLERRAKAGDAAAEQEAQAMVDAVAKSKGMRQAYHSGAEIMEGGIIRAPFFYMTEQRRDAEAHNAGKTTKWFVNLRNPKWVPEHDDRFMDFRGTGYEPDSPELELTESALEFTQFLKSQGYDGIVMPSEMDDPEGPFLYGNNYIAFEPEQIKSADPFTYDEAGNLVPLSQRFDVTRPEISFSLTKVAQISKPTKKDDKFRVGTSKKGTKANPKATTNKDNISFDNIPPKILAAHMAKMNYSHLPKDILAEQDPAKKARKLIDWMKTNLLALHDKFPAELRARATQWYDGANRIAKRLAKQWKLTPQQTAAIMACLSPQKDWFMNVTQAEQVIEIWLSDQGTTVTQDMLDTAGEDIAQAAVLKDSQKAPKQPNETKAQRNARLEENRSRLEALKQERRDLFELAKGKTLAQMVSTPILQAWTVRLLAQYKFGRTYNALTPEGKTMGTFIRDNGNPGTNTWGSTVEILKCISIIKDGSLENISEEVGDMHKVRSFYNNIIAPNSAFGDTTMDTHAVAAAHLMPFGSSAREVEDNFGAAGKSEVYGIAGVYYLYLAAYQEAAAERGILPRQMQSITWEAVRGLYGRDEKGKKLLEQTRAIWQSLPDDEARQQLLARGIERPVWAGPANGGQPSGGPTPLQGGTGQGNDLRAGDGAGTGRASTGAEIEASFSLQPEAMLDNVAANVEARMARSPQARLDMVARARENLTALRDAFLRNRKGAGFVERRSVASLDSEQDIRQALREEELLVQAGVTLASAQDIRRGRADAYRAELANQLEARGIEEKTGQAISREAGVRQTFKRIELVEKVDEDYARSVSQIYRDSGFWDGPVISYLSKKEGGRYKGTLMSYRRAQRYAGKGEYVNPASWDGSHELPRILFSGNGRPDVVAQELFGVMPEVFPSGTTAADVTPDMLWDAISRELAENERLTGIWDDYQTALKATAQEAKEWAEEWVNDYKVALTEARAEAENAADAYVAEATGNNTVAMAAAKQAATETEAWRKRMDQWQRADWDDRAVLTRAMRTLDAVLAAFPAEVRGKVGGWLALARLGTQEAMAKEIERRVEILDKELERTLRADAIKEIRALVDRAMPTRKPGEKPTGKLGAEAHRYFDAVAAVLDLSAADVDARRVALEQELADAATPEEQANVWERQQILDTFGGLDAMKDRVPLHDAADLEAALAQAMQVYQTGRNYWRTIEEARLADVAAKVAGVSAALPAAKTSAILAQGDAAKRIGGMLNGGVLRLRSFREILTILLGKDAPLATEWADRAMAAMHQRTDEMRDMNRRWFAAARKSTGNNRTKTEQELWTLISERTVSAVRRPGRLVEERIPIESIPNLAALGYNAQEIADAEDAFMALSVDMSTARGIAATTGRRLKNMQAGRDSTATFVTITRWEPGTEEEVELTQAEGIYLTMLAAQAQYTRPLEIAGWTAETLAEIEAGLSPLAKDMRAFMADEYRTGYFPLSSLFEGMFGVPLPQIENYAPGKWWSRGAEKAMDPAQAGLVEGGFRAGFLKGRKAHQAAPRLENAFEVFFGHANQTAHWKAMAPLARELRGVFADPDVKQQIVAAHGPEMLAVVNQWMESLEGNGLQIGYSRLYQTMLDWQATTALAWKVGTLLKQSTAALGAAFKIPLREYMSGVGKFIAGRLDVKDIWQSDIIQRRIEGGFSPEVRSAVAKTFLAAPTRRRNFLRAGMELIGYVDAMFTSFSAAIAYDYHLRQAAAKRQALAETERIVTQTAQPVEVTDRSLFEQTGWGKLLLMFGGDSRQKASMWISALAAATKGKATPDDIRVLALSHLVVGPMLQIISSAWMDWRDDDDDQWLDEKNWEAWDFARSILLGPAAGLPLIREIVDDFSGDTGPLAATGKAAADAVAIIKGPPDGEAEAVEWYGKRFTGVMKGLSAFPAVVAGITDQAFRVADNIIETDDETQKRINSLKNKLGREKDPEKQQELRERILGLQSMLK